MSGNTLLGLQLEALCLVITSYLSRAASRAPALKPRCVVIIHLTTNIGDMICATPVFHAIKHQYPKCRIVVVGTVKNKEMLAGLADVDEYVTFGGNVWATIRRLKQEHPDIGIAMNPSPTELGILLCAGAGQVSVFTNPAFTGHAFSILARRAIGVPYEPGAYVPQQYLNLLKPFGVASDDTHRHLAVDASVLATITASHPGKFAVIAPGAGHAYKEWPREHFDAIAAHLKEKHNIATVFVGVTETLEELKALISHATLVIANDSGVVQIAYAFDVPTITIAGATDWREHHLPGPLHRIVHAEGGTVMRSFLSDHEKADEARLRTQMLATSVAQVSTELDSLIASMG